jgi:hypothetical protein
MKTAATIVTTLALAAGAGCTVRIEPLPKPKPRVVYRDHPRHHRHHAHPSETPHGQLVPAEGEEEIRLLPKQPTPPPP